MFLKNTLAYYGTALNFNDWLNFFYSKGPGPNVIKLFTTVIKECFNKLECLTLAGLNIMFASKAGAYPSEVSNTRSWKFGYS